MQKIDYRQPAGFNGEGPSKNDVFSEYEKSRKAGLKPANHYTSQAVSQSQPAGKRERH